MPDYINGCQNATGCPGEPTYIYRPQGGFPVAYCVSCMPHFLRGKVASMETTAHHHRVVNETMQALEPERELVDQEPEPEPEPEPVAEDKDDKEPVKKPAPKRRPRKKVAPKEEEKD
jgi:hypothetical protein